MRKKFIYSINLIGCFFCFLLLAFFSFQLNVYPATSTYFDTVQKIYIGYYQRPADPEGLIYWSGILDSNSGNLTAIIEAFANSDESRTLYGTINSGSISNVVSNIYLALFNRDADKGERDYYLAGFNAGQFTSATIMLNILNGATSGNDLLSVNNKLAAANLFTRTINPDLDGSNFQVTYAGDGDVVAGRNFLALYGTSVKVPTQAETTTYIRANIANPGDAVLPPSAELPVLFQASGHTGYGDWNATVRTRSTDLRPGYPMDLQADLRVLDSHLEAFAQQGKPVSALILLVTAERTFDADGWMRLPSDEKMSTLLTPAGLAIEGGVQGAVTSRYGYAFKSPVDELRELPVASLSRANGQATAHFELTVTPPLDLPPGIYRLRFDFGLRSNNRIMDLNAYTFASRPFPPDVGTYCYSPVLPASGKHVSGRQVDATRIQARVPWVLLANYNSNGYRGVVADEDQGRFALSNRLIIPDEVILPLYDGTNKAISYSLEPSIAPNIIDSPSNLSWDYSKGGLSLDITAPDGSRSVQPATPIADKTSIGPTTRNPAFTAWKPTQYGLHTVKLTGWMMDTYGRRYEGGGTYHFWIAKRMTLATATFQGMPYPVNAKYGRDIAFNPPCPADVEMTATLYPNSDPAQTRSIVSSGKATAGGVFGVAQGMKQMTLDAPGEYHGKVLARYTDPDGHLWVSTMRHAGVVYRDDAPIVARGKKLSINGAYAERGETHTEGWIDADGTTHLQHITFPYNSGDVLLIAAEGQGANKIEPVLIMERKGETRPWDTKLNGVGTSNLTIRTSNGYSPHLFPEYITDIEYYYGAAPRPGFMSRFLVGESIVRAPYWPVSPNAFGGQIGASPSGDLPGDIYRLLGGIVIRDKGQDPAYAGYISSAFLLAKRTQNNRVVAAGSEDLNGATGEKARFFLVGFRPGMALELEGSWRPSLQIDPILPVTIHLVLTYPDGRTKTVDGVSDAFGSFSGSEAYPLDVPGIYRYQVTGTWQGHVGKMPGLPDSGGIFIVFPKDRPIGATGLTLDMPSQVSFPANGKLTVNGKSTAAKVTYALIMPGAVLAQGELLVTGGKFQMVLDPAVLNALAPIYDIKNITTGSSQIGRVLHLTLAAEEKTPDGTRFWDFKRIVVRGTTAVWAK